MFAPTSPGRRELPVNMETLISGPELMIIVVETKVFIFKREWTIYENKLAFQYSGERLFKIQSDLSKKSDREGVTGSFNKSVGMFRGSFGSCDTSVKWNLFNLQRTSFYGAQLRVKRRGTVALFEHQSISYL